MGLHNIFGALLNFHISNLAKTTTPPLHLQRRCLRRYIDLLRNSFTTTAAAARAPRSGS